jgi:hypothetical protein
MGIDRISGTDDFSLLAETTNKQVLPTTSNNSQGSDMCAAFATPLEADAIRLTSIKNRDHLESVKSIDPLKQSSSAVDQLGMAQKSKMTASFRMVKMSLWSLSQYYHHPQQLSSILYSLANNFG